jgi:hypothetical protein
VSLRRRLTLSLFTILVLFAINVGTHFWGSYARSESMVAYRQAVSAGQLTGELAKQLEDQRQKILVLSTLRDNTDDRARRQRPSRPPSSEIAGDPRFYRKRPWAHGSATSRRCSSSACAKAASACSTPGSAFYVTTTTRSDWESDVDDPMPYLEASQRLNGTGAAPGIHRRAAGEHH